MATAYTSLLGLALPVTGELQGTWGTTVNDSITSLLDTAVAGTTTLSADTDVTLSTTTGAANQARQAILLCSGARTVLRTITAPAQSKIYTVINATTGGFSVKLVGVGPTTGVTIVAGESALVAWNGSDFIKISNTGGAASFTNVTVSGTTTLSGLTASTALALNGSKEVVSVTNTGTGNNVLSASPTLTGTISAAAATLSGNLTLSGGTANGVLYLDGSKVATSGSALTFDGTSLGVGRAAAFGVGAGIEAYRVGVATLRLNNATTGQENAFEIQTTSNGPVDFVSYNSRAFAFTTAGSEQMRLTSTGLGIGTSSPSVKLDVQNGNATINRATNATILVLGGAPAANWEGDIQFLTSNTNTNWRLASNRNTSGAFTITPSTAAGGSTFTTPAVTLDSSGNLGIGTSSPGAKLEVNDASTGALIRISSSTNNSARGIEWWNNNSNNVYGSITSDYTSGVFTYDAGRSVYAGQHVFRIGTGGEGMRLDSSGNLGLGVTPSAWSVIGPALQVKQASLVSESFDQLYLSANAFFDGSWKYMQSDIATQYYQASGAHVWRTAPSGTAGNAITFTQAMTLDASGNLGVGTTSPGCRFNATQAASAALGAQIALHNNASTAVGNAVEIALLTDSGASPSGIRNGRIRVVNENAGNGAANMQFWTWSGTTDAERARITSGGELQTFNTFALWPSAAGGAGSYSIKRAATNALTINDDFAGQERLRITSGGDFGIGNNNPQYRLTVDKDTTSALAFFTNSNASAPNGLYVDFSAASPNNATQYFLYCEDSTAQRATIRSNGGLANYQSNNVDLSDSRTKKDIAPAASMWSKIGALEIVTYKYNDQTHDDVNVGVIAQQVEQVEPVWVDSDGFGETPEDGVPLKTVYTKDITFAAIKALQEAMTRIEQLEARIAALEAQ